jgi:uncharacterized protein (DUF2267 family)
MSRGVRKMPKKIFPNERRQWLERYDSGESEAAIAKDAHRDVRTVKKCIAQARRERDVHGARVELLKNALKQHNDRLVNAVKEMESALVMPVRDLWIPWRQNAPPSPIGFIGSTATYEAGKGYKVALTAESKPEWGLVQEHLKGDPMWASLTAWRRALAAHVEARRELGARCADLLMEKTGYKLVEQSVDRSDELPFLYVWSTLDLIYQAVLDRPLAVEQATKLEGTIVVDTERGAVRHANAILAEAPGDEERCKANILAALKEALESKEAAKVEQTYKELAEATIKAKRSVEEILLLELVPGECRVCRRLGI